MVAIVHVRSLVEQLLDLFQNIALPAACNLLRCAMQPRLVKACITYACGQVGTAT
jgi:hypothetical protein